MKKVCLCLLVVAISACNAPDILEKKEYQNPQIITFLENNLGWKNNENSKVFCSYHLLGKKDLNLFIKASCREFYLQDKELICPTYKTLNQCYEQKLTNSNDPCDTFCEIKNVPKYLVEGSGIDTLVRITQTNSSYDLWSPVDGSGYWKSLEENFPSDILEKLQFAENNFLQEKILINVENHFNIPLPFHVDRAFEQSCLSLLDCYNLQKEGQNSENFYCLKNKCVAGTFQYRRNGLLHPKRKELEGEEGNKIDTPAAQ